MSVGSVGGGGTGATWPLSPSTPAPGASPAPAPAPAPSSARTATTSTARTTASPARLGAAPTPEEFASAWDDAFGPVLRAAAGSDGRLTLAEAKRISRRDSPDWLASDNAAGFLGATGQRTIGAEVLRGKVRDYIVREARRIAGSNGRISLAEAARLPKDLRDDFLFLRGKGLPQHRTWNELAVEVRDLVGRAFADWRYPVLPQAPRAVRGERPILESVRHPTDPSTRAIVYVADGRVYASIARSGTAAPGTPGVGWYDLGPVPPER